MFKPIVRAGIVLAAGSFLMLVGGVIAAKAAIALLVIAFKALGITVGGILATLLPAILIVAVLGAVVAGFVVAFQRNIGGIADFARRIGERVRLFFNGLKQLFEQGGFSGAVREELNRAENQGLKRFLISLYQIVYRIQQVWEGFKEGFSRTIEEARPVFEDLMDAFSELGREIGALFSGLTGGAAGLPSSEFRSFGQAAGAAIATVVRWLPQLVAVFTRITSGIIGGFRSMQEYIGPAFEVVGEALGELRDAWNALTGSSKDSTKATKDTVNWPRAVRDAYTKLSAGHVSIDLLETREPLSVPEPGVVDDHTRGKLARAAYWYRRLRVGRKRVLEGVTAGNPTEFAPDAEHPRILAAVAEIEAWTLKREKVLVFGVFLRPLRLLRDVVNVRHALRAADAGRPIAHAVHSDSALLGIALRQLERLRAEGGLSGRLATGNGASVRRALADSHKAYEKLRRKVRDRAKKAVVAWRLDPTLLGGAPSDRAVEGALEDHLVSFVLDDFLAATSESDAVTHERFDALTAEFVEERLRPILGELGDEDVDAEQAVLRQEALRALLEDEDGRQSLHARLLQGATRWETRRYLQAAFNRAGASPWVLIAQSQVGREGLNLHESCRVVVQFHAEWNPAVLEQQIGRVDRKGSLWERRARAWLEGDRTAPPPFVEVRQLVFEGTYDAFQWDRVMRRQLVFDASLFGSLLPADAWLRVPAERVQDLLDAAPSFRPPPAK